MKFNPAESFLVRLIPSRSQLYLLLFILVQFSVIGSTFARESRYPEFSSGRIEQPLVTAKRFMASTANPYASEAAMRILARGGTAIDAGIAAQMVLNLVEPESSGIGGGGFALYWDNAQARLSSYDGREKAPLRADENLFQIDGANMSWWNALAGGRAVGVPGLVAMLEKMHRRHGKLPWASLFEDAIRLSEEGFEIPVKLAHAIANKTNPALGRYTETQHYFYPEGKALQAGTIKKNPQLANTLRQIARQGARTFYTGAIATDIVNAVQSAKDNPGLLSIADMQQYQAIQRVPVCAPYRQYTLCGMGPPTSGGMTVIQILKLLEQQPLEQLEPLSPEAMHLFTQASRLAFADRNRYMADADYVDVPVAGLIAPDYLKKRSRLISKSDMAQAEAGTPPGADRQHTTATSPEQPGTTHFSIVDQYGNALSLTSSIEMAFGSTLMVRGFLLNNQLTDFSFSAIRNGGKVANRVQPGKRPRSSMSPFMVFDREGKLLMLIGSPGGSRIINYVAKTLLGVLDWSLDIQQAINLPHVVNQNGATELEQGTAAEKLLAALEQRGHSLKIRDLNSGLHGIVIKPDRLEGGADPRRVGRVLGQ